MIHKETGLFILGLSSIVRLLHQKEVVNQVIQYYIKINPFQKQRINYLTKFWYNTPQYDSQ